MSSITLSQNTKTEILEAYNKLKKLVGQAKGTADDASRSHVSQSIDQLESTLAVKSAELEELEKQVDELREQISLSKRLALTQDVINLMAEKFTQEHSDWERRKDRLEDKLTQRANAVRSLLDREFVDAKKLLTQDEAPKSKSVSENGNEKKYNYSSDPQTEVFSSKHS